MADINGQELLDIANGSWNDKRQDYRGFNYTIAVGQAKKGIEKKRGGNKDRKAEAQHQVSVLFTHARAQAADRLTKVALEAGAPSSDGVAATDTEELTAFATEVTELLNGSLSGGFGIIDPTMIIGLIQTIIQAIAACKKPPVPVTP